MNKSIEEKFSKITHKTVFYNEVIVRLAIVGRIVSYKTLTQSWFNSSLGFRLKGFEAIIHESLDACLDVEEKDLGNKRKQLKSFCN